MCGKSPKPDPAIGQAALRQAELSKEALQLGREELEYQKTQDSKFDDYYKTILDSAIEDMKTQKERGDQQWDFYQSTFKPIEEKFASDAMSWDSKESIQKAGAEAGATIQTQIGLQQDAAKREAGRVGVSADKVASQMVDDANTLGLAKAGAINNAQTTRQLQGTDMRQAASNFGRNMPNTSIALNQSGNQNAGVGMNAIGNERGQHNAGFSTALQPYQMSMSANNSTANIYNQMYQNQVSAANGKFAAIGAVLGAGATIGAAYLGRK